MSFGSHADRVVGHVVALVNGLTPGFEGGRPLAAPTAEQSRRRAEAILETTLTPGEGEGIAELAARLRPVFEAAGEGDADGAALLVNELLQRYRPAPYLARHDGPAWHLHYHSPDADRAASWGAGCAAALASVLGSAAWDRLGVCSAPRCDRVFVDLSRNGSRRFCSTACQNRTKAAALRARRRAQ